MDVLPAARAQMGLTLAFHMVLAASAISMPVLMLMAEGMWLRTGRPHYRDLARKWAKVTALLFAIGAVSGTALSFELGLLWPRFMGFAGSIVGPAFALEGSPPCCWAWRSAPLTATASPCSASAIAARAVAFVLK